MGEAQWERADSHHMGEVEGGAILAAGERSVVGVGDAITDDVD